MVVVLVISHVDITVEGTKHPMSNFLYFLFFSNLLLLFLPKLLSLIGVKGLQLLSFFSSWYSMIFFLSEGNSLTCLLQELYKGSWIIFPLYVWMPSTVWMVTSFYHVLGEGTTEVVEDKVTMVIDVEVHSGKVSRLTYTISVGGFLDANVNHVNSCFSMK